MTTTIVAIDGPAGSGKSTVARALAQRLRLPHLDTGAVYRTVALRALAANTDLQNEDALVRLSKELDLSFACGSVIINGSAPGLDIRTRDVGVAASQISVHPAVRAVLVSKQRDLLHRDGGVAEGRDIGTVVAPDATLKIYLTASPEERAARRLAEHQGEEISLQDLASEIAARDARDEQRAASPLRPAEDAVFIDTTGRQPEDVVEEIATLLDERQPR